jgi:phosphoglycerate dehydrogenase-like enzyme
MRLVLAIHDPPIWTLPGEQVDRIRAALPDVEVTDARTEGERRHAFPAADVLVTTWMTPEEEQVLDRVRWIHSTAVGVGGLLRPAVVSRGIPVTNSRGVHAEPIAEHALALALALRRGLHVAHARQVAHRWDPEALYAVRVRPLSATCLLLVGLGAIGSRVAALASGLGMRVIGARRRVERAMPPGVAEVFPVDRLHDALRQADIVVLAAPHTHGTGALIGAAEFAVMRPTAVLVNVARGALVHEAALVSALETGRIAAAGLDAFAREPLAGDSPLWALPNVLITPHSASFQGDYWGPVVDLFLDNMRRFRRGEPLRNVVDPGLGY